MELVDTHCHLSSLEDKPLEEVIARAKDCSVKRFICIGASDGLVSARQAVALSEQWSQVWATVGVHPHDAAKVNDLAPLNEFLPHPKVVAIGETGLDFFRDWAPVEAQYERFEQSIELAKSSGKPLVIHCRDAAKEIFEVLTRLNARDVGGVFHCYSEDAAFAAKLRDLNFLVSFTGNITFKKAQALREAVREIPLEQIMLETDCPYMAPEPFRGKPSEPMHVYQVALTVAKVKNLSLEEVAVATTTTAKKFFRL